MDGMDKNKTFLIVGLGLLGGKYAQVLSQKGYRVTGITHSQSTLDYALEQGIPLLDFALNRTDDIGHYLYACLKLRKCAICGREGEIHHVDTIGMGNDRRKVDDSYYRKICLCRQHHTEAHNIGMIEFESKYKVYGIRFGGD